MFGGTYRKRLQENRRKKKENVNIFWKSIGVISIPSGLTRRPNDY